MTTPPCGHPSFARRGVFAESKFKMALYITEYVNVKIEKLHIIEVVDDLF